MNKAELIDAMAAGANLSKADAKKAGNLLSGTRLTGYVDPFSRAEEAESVQIKGLAKL